MKWIAGFTSKFVFVLFLFVLFFSYAMFQGGFVSWFLFYSFLPVLIYMACLLFYPISNWEVERKMDRYVTKAGERVHVQVSISRKSVFPIYYCIIEESLPLSLQKKDTLHKKYEEMRNEDAVRKNRLVKLVSFPWFRKVIRFDYTLDQLPRGEHHFSQIRIKTGDLFGFIKKEHVYEVSSRMLVYPNEPEITVRERVSSYEEGSTTSFNVNVKQTNVVTGVREYMPGDRFSWIDWKTTAKKNAVMTKEFEQEKSSSILLILDSGHHDEFYPIAYEASIEITASLVESIKRHSSRMAFLSLGQERVYFPFQQSPGKLDMIKTHLAKVQAIPSVPFSNQIINESRKIPEGVVLMLVVSHFDEKLELAIEQLKQKSKKIVVFYVHPKEQESGEDRVWLQKLSASGIVVNELTEEQLVQQKIEVNT
ncbi:DUF58 domain-containing protein [Radiobacillus kanasensis]|uniref:DUF58 domain-containing protein n=1 Tax=Radiobacillus kanasensis TaxID=2844358 RepID=UPI001E36530F|nr:DUF58 domain-containing protein [Radiobacillus kanasensis]UFT99896.1 DUF58 domain-containing protein [Radiobacillus kanasensis]